MNRDTIRSSIRVGRLSRIGLGLGLAGVLTLSASAEAALKLTVTPLQVKGGLKAQTVVRNALPLVNFTLTFRAGSATDPAGKEGLARLTAEALRAGAGSRSASALAEALDGLGASLIVRTSRDATSLSLECLSRDIGPATSLLADLVLRPTFEAAELARIKRSLLAEIQSRRDNPGDAASVAFNEQLFRGHVYGHADSGSEKSVSSLTEADVKGFHQSAFRPELAQLVVVGDFKGAELKKALDQAFGDWPKKLQKPSLSLAAAPPAPAPMRGEKVVLVHQPGLTQAQIRIGNLAWKAGEPGESARAVVNTALGGGFTSRLVDEIRVNRSLSYGASSNFSSWQAGGTFVISTFTKNETVGETVKVALDVLKTLKEKGLPAQELEKAKNFGAGRFAMDVQSPEAVGTWLQRIWLYGLPLTYLTEYADRLQAVNEKEVPAALGQLPLEDRLVVIYADKTGVEAQLKPFGELCVVEALEYSSSACTWQK